MKRRQLLALLSLAAARPFAATAQPAGRMRRVGALMGPAAFGSERQSEVAAFLQRLRELGWTDGRNIRIDVKVLGRANVKATLGAQGLDVAPSTPKQFAAHIKSEIARFGKIAKAAGIKAE